MSWPKTAVLPNCGLFFALRRAVDTFLITLYADSKNLTLRLCLMSYRYTDVLVADDDPISRGIVAEQLMRLGSRNVRSANSGRQALKMLQSTPEISLLVTDLKMPDLDGIRLLRELSSIDHTIDVIIMSALGDKVLNAAQMLCKESQGPQILGVSGKPIDLKSLREMLESGGQSRGGSSDVNPIEQALESGAQYAAVTPVLDIEKNACEWVELRSRWTHPSLQSRTPKSVIEEARESQLIHTILRHRIRDAGNLRAQWIEGGLTIPRFGINLATENLADPSLPDWAITVVARFGLQPEHVVFEAPESALEESRSAAHMINRLADAGFAVALDHYGAGSTSVESLKSLPLQYIKIDSRLIANFEKEFEANMLVESSVQLANNQGWGAVASGVSNDGQKRKLQQMGYTLMQGPLFTPPLKAEEFPAWYTQHLSSTKPRPSATGQA